MKNSKKGIKEVGSQVVLDVELIIVENYYHANVFVADCRYEVLLGMRWNKGASPKINYDTHRVVVDSSELPVKTVMEEDITVSALEMKEFLSMLINNKGKDI